MNINEIKAILANNDEYKFLYNNEHLGSNIGIITLGGSIAYGTNNENSDIDIRGMFVPTAKEIVLSNYKDQVEDRITDTVIYNIDKLITLLTNCNPNTIEMLGNRPEYYLYVSKYGQMLLDNVNLFLSKKCIYTFGGYATAQLRRLENKCIRDVEQAKREKHILDTINNAKYSFSERYPINSIDLYIDDSNQENYDKEIFIDVDLKHYPLRDYNGMIDEFKSIVTSYNKNSTRNSKAIAHNKLGKHMMHLIRLYMMCIDILESGKVITYRENEHDLLMDIRNNKYLKDGQPTSDFYDMLNDYEKRFEYAKANTSLPDAPNYTEIENLKYDIYADIIKSNM